MYEPAVPVRAPEVLVYEPALPVRAPEVLAYAYALPARAPAVLVYEPALPAGAPEVLACEPALPVRVPEVLDHDLRLPAADLEVLACDHRVRYRHQALPVVPSPMPTPVRAMPLPLSDVLAMLGGRWRGEGQGEYPGVPPFRYVEETTFAAQDGWPLLHVVQKTWREPGGASHLEVGLLIPQGDGRLLFNCAQDGGRTEVMLGAPAPSADGGLAIAWETRDVSNDPRIVRAGRTWRMGGGAQTLAYEAFVATHRTPAYRRHLAATLRRVA